MLGKLDRRVDSLREQERALEESVREREESEAAAAGEDEAKLVTVHELVEAVERLQKTPDDSKLEQITEVRVYFSFFLVEFVSNLAQSFAKALLLEL